eukprot:gene9903-18500_t
MRPFVENGMLSTDFDSSALNLLNKEEFGSFASKKSVVEPNGLIVNLFGPVEERRHDSEILGMSGLLDQLERYSFSPTGQPSPVRRVVLSPVNKPSISP